MNNIEMLSKNGLMIRTVQNPTTPEMLAAVSQTITALQFINNPPEAVQMAALAAEPRCYAIHPDKITCRDGIILSAPHYPRLMMTHGHFFDAEARLNVLNADPVANLLIYQQCATSMREHRLATCYAAQTGIALTPSTAISSTGASVIGAAILQYLCANSDPRFAHPRSGSTPLYLDHYLARAKRAYEVALNWYIF